MSYAVEGKHWDVVVRLVTLGADVNASLPVMCVVCCVMFGALCW